MISMSLNSNVTDVTSIEGYTNPSRAPEFTTDF